MDNRDRIVWVITTLIAIPSAFYALWTIPPFHETETSIAVDAAMQFIALPLVLLLVLALVVYAIRDLQRTRSIWAALFGLYVLSVGAVVVILVNADVYEHDGLIETVSVPEKYRKPE